MYYSIVKYIFLQRFAIDSLVDNFELFNDQGQTSESRKDDRRLLGCNLLKTYDLLYMHLMKAGEMLATISWRKALAFCFILLTALCSCPGRTIAVSKSVATFTMAVFTLQLTKAEPRHKTPTFTCCSSHITL